MRARFVLVTLNNNLKHSVLRPQRTIEHAVIAVVLPCASATTVDYLSTTAEVAFRTPIYYESRRIRVVYSSFVVRRIEIPGIAATFSTITSGLPRSNQYNFFGANVGLVIFDYFRALRISCSLRFGNIAIQSDRFKTNESSLSSISERSRLRRLFGQSTDGHLRSLLHLLQIVRRRSIEQNHPYSSIVRPLRLQ